MNLTLEQTKQMFHFKVWKRFNEKVYHSTITAEDRVGNKFFLDSITKVQGENTIEEPILEIVYKFEKNGEKYIIPESYISKLPLDPIEVVEGYLKESDKTIFKYVTVPESAKIDPKKTRELRAFIDGWNPLEHSNEKTRIFLNMLMVATDHMPVKMRLCSEPAGGKNANYSIKKYITPNVIRLAKPTLAKFETALHFNKTLIIDEITSLSPSEVRELEPAALTISDESPDLEKHSMAKNKAMSLMNLEETSIIYPYNTISDLTVGSTFFDDVWKNKKAFADRHIALLLDGIITERRSTINKKEAENMMEKYWPELVSWSQDLLYHTKNIKEQMHNFEKTHMTGISARQFTNFESVIHVIDAYCRTQEEFNSWMEFVMGMVNNYKKMVRGMSNSVPEKPLEEFVK